MPSTLSLGKLELRFFNINFETNYIGVFMSIKCEDATEYDD